MATAITIGVNACKRGRRRDLCCHRHKRHRICDNGETIRQRDREGLERHTMTDTLHRTAWNRAKTPCAGTFAPLENAEGF